MDMGRVRVHRPRRARLYPSLKGGVTSRACLGYLSGAVYRLRMVALPHHLIVCGGVDLTLTLP